MTEKEIERAIIRFNNKRELLLKRKNLKLRNENVKSYAEICKKFSRDTYNYIHLYENKKYLVSSGNVDWQEYPITAIGIDVSWAFRLSDEEIEFYAGEQLFANLKLIINLYLSGEDVDNIVNLEKFLRDDSVETVDKIYYAFDL